MPPSNLVLSKMSPDSDVVLRNLFEHYIHDMAEWFDIDTKADGSYSYDTAAVWAKGSDVYLAKTGDSLAGFAIVGTAREWLGDTSAHDVHEFFIIRRYRRHGLGRAMAELLWNERPGEWLVRVLEANKPAVIFWRTAISEYTGGTYEEERRTVAGRSWRFFRFGHRPRSNSSIPS